MLGAMFLRGFKEVIAIAVVIVVVYLVLNVIVLGSGLGLSRSFIHGWCQTGITQCYAATGTWHTRVVAAACGPRC